jgi:hypothetical protein
VEINWAKRIDFIENKTKTRKKDKKIHLFKDK